MHDRQRQKNLSCKGAASAVSRRGRLVRALFLLALMLALTACAFGGGSGTASNPYLIATEAHLRDIAAAPHLYKGKYFLQTADIKLNGDWKPIGHAAYYREFSGRFDGNGHRITGLTIREDSSGCGSLFGFIGDGGEVRNLTVETSPEGVAPLDWDTRVGIIAAFNRGLIENCITRGRVVNASVAGGITATSSGIIKNCINYATISATSEDSCYAGGIVAINDGVDMGLEPCNDAQVSGCTNHAAVSALGTFMVIAGGIAGQNTWGLIDDSFNKGAVSAEGGSYETYAGGVAGYNLVSSVARCLNTGAVSATGEPNHEGERGPTFAGGLVGRNGGRISDSRSAVDATARGGKPSRHGIVLGEQNGEVSNCGELRQ